MQIINFIKIIIQSLKNTRKLLTYPINKLRFNKWHLRSYIKKPLFITPKFISVGNHVYVFSYARIEGVCSYNKTTYHPEIILHDGVSIQQGLHLTCANRIEIGDNTAIAANVTITDIHHPYTDINIPIERQDIEVKEVYIGEDCKIYNGAVILPGVHVGKHVTIGANSVVNIDIPDYSVAAGAPVRIIKRYNPQSQNWEKTDKQGNFIA